MYRRSLAVLLWLVLGLGLMTPMSTRALSPLVPVVLIHGQGGSPDLTWKTAVAHLEGRGYRQGETLFPVDLSGTGALLRPLGLLDDTAAVIAEIHRVLTKTGASEVDLVGHSRGGLIARLIAAGDTSVLVRRAVTINTPHEGALTVEQLKGLLSAAGVTVKRPSELNVPEDLRWGSAALAVLETRARRFADRPVPALAIASTWREGLPADLRGHDGAVTVKSQLAWPGARTALFRLGPTDEELQAILRSELAAGLLVLKSPHLQSLESPAVLDQIAEFLLDRKLPAPARPCDPNCQDWADLAGHPAAAELRTGLTDLIPYDVGAKGQRIFQPDRPMTRAEFLTGVARGLGLEEKFRAPAYAEAKGHWAAGWIQAAREARLIEAGPAFAADQPITRAEAAVLIALARGLPDGATPTRFADVRGHRGEAQVEAVAALRWLEGDKNRFRPDEPLTFADGALLLTRAFK